MWAMPLLLSMGFMALVVAWAQDNDRLEREALQRAVVADTLSLEAQLTARLETETATLLAAASRLPAATDAGSLRLNSMPEIAAGLDRRWLSVIWLDANNRIVAEARRDHRRGAQGLPHFPGISLHLAAPIGDVRRAPSGQLIARYDPGDLIKSKDFWWLAAQYEVQLLSGLDEVILSTENPGRAAAGETYETPFRAVADARLRLTQRTRQPHWFTTLPVVLMGGFLVLIAIASLLLRRQMNRVAQAEGAWRTEAAWRQSLEESALVGLRARGLDGRLLFANRTFCDLVGYSFAELQAQGAAFEEPTPPLLEPGAQPVERVGHEARWHHRDGRVLDVMVFESPLIDGSGTQVGWMGSIVDVTERKRLEELERRQREVLANHARLSTLGEVASTLAHELNQPLTSMVGFASGIARALAKQPDTNPELLAAAQALSRHATQAGGIVHRIRTRLARRELVLEACDTNTVIRAAAVLLTRDLKRAGVVLSLDLADGLPRVCMDRIGIEQVITNLMRNAIDAMAGVRHKRSMTVRTQLNADGSAGKLVGGVTVEVVDVGPGLEGRGIETLMEPFYSTKDKGTGLGLAICRSILESHGSSLRADAASAQGGACFRFSLPPEPRGVGDLSP